MKTKILKYSFLFGFLIFLIACSTKKNSFLSRNSHALSTEYNILYNGGIALETGINELKTTYKDNFWERLSVERMQISEENILPGQTKNPNFERAETKAIKAIQKHSMNIAGSEKNPQMDEAHLMLGKARYYDQRYVPALEAFNYVLYKYPGSDKIYEVKIWREKTNMRMENDALAVKNLSKLLQEIKFKDQIFADANAALAQAFLNLEEKDSAVSKLKLARDFSKQKEEQARYRFILGQLYEELGYQDSAFAAYQEVINMKRKSPRIYVIQAHARQAQQFDYQKGDTLAFTKKFKTLLKDRENRPYLDVLNHQMALFYDKNKQFDLAKNYYNKSLKSRSQDAYLIASNYRNMADIHFNQAEYVASGQYYDSTLVQLNVRSREYISIKKKRENLVDVIKYEGIASRNDSIIRVYSMSKNDQIQFYEDHINKIKKEDEIKKALAEKAASAQGRQNAGKDDSAVAGGKETAIASGRSAPGIAPPSMNAASGSAQSVFYFYNPTTVAFGKTEFRKIWGERTYKDNWRVSTSGINSALKDDANVETLTEEALKEKEKQALAADVRYTTDFYLAQLPKSQLEIDSIAKERNFAYYQLGVIYKEKFKEYQLAASKLEQLLQNKPEERLILPSMYNLYKIYEIINKDKALAMKNQIISQFPESRYAQILGNSNLAEATSLTPETAYTNLYKKYESGDYRTVLTQTELAIDQYTGEEMVSKFELLKAQILGKLKGLEEYKKSLNYVALTYPNNDEGKQAELLLGNDIPVLENLQFNEKEPRSWKILYRFAEGDAKNTKALQDKIKKYIAERKTSLLTSSLDIYTMDSNFVVIHGISSEESATGIASVLKDFKEYKITEVPIIISSDNYGIVQIKKNLEEYLADPKKPAVKKTPAPKPILTPDKNPMPRGSQTKILPPDTKPREPASNMNQNPNRLTMPPQELDNLEPKKK